MFKLDLEPTFEATVRIPQPGGARVPVRVRFNFLDADAYRETFEACRDLPAVAWVGKLVAGWETTDCEGQWEGMPMPYSQEALETLAKKQPRAVSALIDAYQHEALGLPLKN